MQRLVVGKGPGALRVWGVDLPINGVGARGLQAVH